MQISPINYKTNLSFQAVNQKYLERAQKEFCKKGGMVGDILECLRAEVYFKQITVQDAIDTIKAIKKLAGKTNDFLEHVLDSFEKYKSMTNQ